MLVVTTLTSFPIHGFPDDYFRYTPSGLKSLMEDAGFRNVETVNEGAVRIRLNNHGAEWSQRDLPLHVFGVGQC
jgi:hypothetical protein